MLLVFGIQWFNCTPLLFWLTIAPSLSIIVIVVDKGSFFRDQVYIKKK